ncbi:AbrB family transcriptional regulator [Bacillus sp. RAR_GA_16]|uniref:AbrB family transcriptional regulator n=1 Tax=Bacillus sp. RAR_GA_16 TaxID=2876774 RepID=UPI001CC9B798|nr:AbrB family transcriptional regulator [Bacillus sp. RAR_GA_16]MCA0172517.1 AbrB family transcriptional regulator [Bacillus sp. RAR_GA_16]
MLILRRNRFVLYETILIGLVGALVFKILHAPLPWMLGPLTGVATWHLSTGRTLYWPIHLRNLALILIGYMLGASFTQRTLHEISLHFPYMLGVTLSTVMGSLLLGLIIVKKTNVNVIDGLFGSVPGGLSQVAILSEETKEVDTGTIVFMQTIRVVLVIVTIPFLTMYVIKPEYALINGGESLNREVISYPILFGLLFVAIVGAFLGKKGKLPAAFLTGPLIVIAIFSISPVDVPDLPSSFILISQFLLGIHLGLYLKKEMLRHIRKVGVYSLMTSVLLICFSFLIAIFLTNVTSLTLATAFLSTAPGGLAEMGVTATIIDADLAMISGYQLFRIFFIMFVVLPLIQWWIRRRVRMNDRKFL